MHLYFYFKVDYFAMKISRQLARLIFKLFWLAILPLQNHINIPGLLDRALARLIVWALSRTLDRTQSTTLSVLCRQVHAIRIRRWCSIWSPSISFVCIASLFHAVPATLSFLTIREACLPHFRRSLPAISCKVLFLFLYEISTGWRPIVSFTRLTGLGHELFVEPGPYSAYHL